MCCCAKPIALAALALLLSPVGAALAQPGNAFGAVTPAFNNPYWGYTNDPYGGYLHGAADVIRAQSMYMVSYQEAAKLKQEVRAAKIDNRRKELEQWLWERENLPTHEDERQRYLREQYKRSLNNPPLTEVWSGKALNDLLDYSQKNPVQDVEVNEQLLARINVTSGKRAGNIGLLKDGRIAWWPLLLRRGAFDGDRDRIESLTSRAVEMAMADKTGDSEYAAAIEELLRRVKAVEARLGSLLKTAGDEFTPSMYMDARSFLSQLHDAIRVLQQPDVGEYFKSPVKGKTVAEVIRNMDEQGLRFAPATPGGETAYTALHRALARALRPQS